MLLFTPSKLGNTIEKNSMSPNLAQIFFIPRCDVSVMTVCMKK